MACFKWLQRFRQSRGYGVHSPFAFQLIQKVLSSRAHYYAFDEIADHLSSNHPHVPLNKPYHHLSFRLVRHFNAMKILEINSGRGVNTLYLLSPDSRIHCTCVEARSEMVTEANELTAIKGNQRTILPALPREERFDAIFLHLDVEPLPTLDSLIQLSHEETFWVIDRVNATRSKQYWRNIVNDERIGTTFDMKEIGITFLRHINGKKHYLI